MTTADIAFWTWGLTVLHTLGLTSACCARMFSGGRMEPIFQIAFLALLGSVALTILGGYLLFPAAWLPSAVVFAAMVLVATWDLRCSTNHSAA